MTISPPQSAKLERFAHAAAYAAAIAVLVPTEFQRLRQSIVSGKGFSGWLGAVEPLTFAYALLLLAAPLCWLMRRAPIGRVHAWDEFLDRWFGPSTKPAADSRQWAGFRAWTLSLAVGLASLSASLHVASIGVGSTRSTPLGEMPPAYHDEYSYLFQAKTFLANRLWFPSHPTTPRIFDQMHVLNEGRFASRYFPGAGAWIAPFLAVGHPYWGHWLAGMLTAVFVFWAGRELGGNGIGLMAGLLTALSPGMAVFSNLLLAHHPTLVGLSFFLFQFLRMIRTGSGVNALLSGAGLAYAMLCRPMTAAGFGLPFGVWMLWKLVCGHASPGFDRLQHRLALAAAMGAPLLAGLIFLFSYNRAITGSGWTTPYQVYTDTYTPRHVYGFNNVVRGERKLGPNVLDHYDRWAENLTPRLAVRNLWERLLASWQWTLAAVPLAMAGVVFVVLAGSVQAAWWLIAGAIVTLHLVHVPYWYVGIMHYHYVFETGPLWLLLFAGMTQRLVGCWRMMGRHWMPLWWTAVVLAAVVCNWGSAWIVGAESRLDREINNLAFARGRYHRFRRLIAESVTRRPALVLVMPDPEDRHIDYVVNEPSLQSGVLFGRFRPGQTDLEDTLLEFPERAWYIFDAATGELQRLERNPDR